MKLFRQLLFFPWACLLQWQLAFTLIIRAAEIFISSFGLIYIIKAGFNLMNNKVLSKNNEDKQSS